MPEVSKTTETWYAFYLGLFPAPEKTTPDADMEKTVFTTLSRLFSHSSPVSYLSYPLSFRKASFLLRWLI